MQKLKLTSLDCDFLRGDVTPKHPSWERMEKLLERSHRERETTDALRHSKSELEAERDNLLSDVQWLRVQRATILAIAVGWNVLPYVLDVIGGWF